MLPNPLGVATVVRVTPGWITVESLADAVADPPPDTLAWFTSDGGACEDTTTDTVMDG